MLAASANLVDRCTNTALSLSFGLNTTEKVSRPLKDTKSDHLTLEKLRPAQWFRSHRVRLVSSTLVYILTIIAILVALIGGYRSQIDLRLEERTRELEVAYETVASTVAATPELVHAQVAANGAITRLMQDAHLAEGPELAELRSQLLGYLAEDYVILQELEFRQLHFHLRDNRSFLRFHRPERFGDDLSDARPTVRAANETLLPAYGFEEGRIINGFRYVYPLFHDAEHVGSFEISMNYQAVLSRIRASRPVALDFVLSQQIIERTVFDDELENYEPSCFSSAFARETTFGYPDTSTVLGLEYDCILGDLEASPDLTKILQEYQKTSLSFTTQGVPVVVSLLPVRNFEGDYVAFILGYSRFDELPALRRFFWVLGLTLLMLTTAVFILFLRTTQGRERLTRIGEDLQRTIQAKNRFFSIVSHDLRGPVGSLATLCRMLDIELKETAEVPASTRETAEIIASGAENASQLLHDLLDWSRSQRGDITYDPAEHPLHELVGSQITILERAAAEKSISLRNDVGEVTVYGDEYMIKTILRNLLSNGIKFTPDGGSISVSATSNTKAVVISVTDTGVGMTEQQQADIYDFSIKASTKGTRSEAGTGLGFTVCNEFVRVHQGKITVESELGVGTAFYIHLPRS